MNTFSNFLQIHSSVKRAFIICFALISLLVTAGNAYAQDADESAANESSAPGIAIKHSVNKGHVLPGESAIFTVVVTNTGNVVLDSVKVTNPNVTDCARQIGAMTPGQVFTYSCELEDITETATSKVTVIGSATNLPLVIASAEVRVDVIRSVLSIVKEPVQGSPRRGDNIIMTYSYTNSGTGAVIGVQLVETVPVGMNFVPELSAGWSCENDVIEAGALCFFSIDRIEAGESAEGQFPFVVVKIADAADSEETTVVGSGSVVGNQLPKSLFLPLINS